MGLVGTVINNLAERRNRIIQGKTNCLPLPFSRFSRSSFPGLERERYIIITANQKVGKSKLADYLCVYNPLFKSMDKDDPIKFKVLYFTLEMSKEAKTQEFLCHLLYKLDNIRIDTTDLKSTRKESPIPEEYLELLNSERYKPYIEKFEECITFIDDIKNPTGINKYCREFAEENGKFYYKTVPYKDEMGIERQKEIIDKFEWNDPDCYYIVLLDNFSNLSLESGLKKMDNIDKMSKYFITLRNQLKYCIVAVQHQAQAQEGIDNLKLGKLAPSSDGMADCRTTTRDLNCLIGVFNPFKHELKEYMGYDITKFTKYIRFMSIIEDRDNGGAGDVCPLFFDGAVTEFIELPLPNDKGTLQKIYDYVDKVKNEKKNKISISKTFFIYAINSIKKLLTK